VHQSNDEKRVTPPAFPKAAVLDPVLYDYLRRADRMGWSPYDLCEQEQMRTIARPERLSEVQLAAVKTVLFVEDHLPMISRSSTARCSISPAAGSPRKTATPTCSSFT
jgi:hypothetical protein